MVRGGSAIEEDETRRATRILAVGGSVSVLLDVTLVFCTAGTPDVVHVMFPPSGERFVLVGPRMS